MNDKVIYTSLVGTKDALKNPTFVMAGWDYICFSNHIKKNKDNDLWDIKPIPFRHCDNLILSRYPKINPHEVLSGYDYSLWIDANIEILDNFIEQRIDELIKQQIYFSLIPHPHRDCIYKEAKICIEIGKDKRKIIEKQVDFLRKEKYPENNGLFENGLIFRNHTDPRISSLNKEWWALYLKYSKRDQLSLCYLLWKNNIHCEPFTTKGLSVRNIPSIKYELHRRSLIQKAKNYIQRKINKYF